MLEEANSFVENIDSNNATTDTIPKEKAKPVMQKSQVGEKLTSPHKMLTKKDSFLFFSSSVTPANRYKIID